MVGITVFTQVAREVFAERWHLKKSSKELRDGAWGDTWGEHSR